MPLPASLCAAVARRVARPAGSPRWPLPDAGPCGFVTPPSA